MAELVTAIVPTYRRAHLLERSIGSILRQTWRPLELIVVDDGSGDNTQEVLAGWADKAKAAGVDYRWYEKENGGPGLARNYAMERANGELFAFLDDDDRWYPQKIETQMAHMRMHPAAGVSFTRYVDEGKEDLPKPGDEHMHDGWVFERICRGQTRARQQTLMVRREVQERVGGFVAARNWEDSEYELRLALETEFVAVREPLTVSCTSRAASAARPASKVICSATATSCGCWTSASRSTASTRASVCRQRWSCGHYFTTSTSNT